MSRAKGEPANRAKGEPTSFKVICFDLDDTLVDTSGFLLKPALTASWNVINKVHPIPMPDFLDLRAKANQLSFRDWMLTEPLFSHIPRETILESLEKFYSPPLPDKIFPLPGAMNNLQRLHKKYRLFLVTMGIEASQLKKVEALTITEYFEKIYVVDFKKESNKLPAFKEILDTSGVKPHEILSIGDRRSQEIRFSNLLGFKTALFINGEHKDEQPVLEEDKPDFIIHHHSELMEKCRL